MDAFQRAIGGQDDLQLGEKEGTPVLIWWVQLRKYRMAGNVIANEPIDRFIAALHRNSIDQVVDVRTSP